MEIGIEVIEVTELQGIASSSNRTKISQHAHWRSLPVEPLDCIRMNQLLAMVSSFGASISIPKQFNAQVAFLIGQIVPVGIGVITSYQAREFAAVEKELVILLKDSTFNEYIRRSYERDTGPIQESVLRWLSIVADAASRDQMAFHVWIAVPVSSAESG